EPASGAKRAATTGPVDLNTASQADLEGLPGIGAATAKKIIAGRPYASVNDLARAGVPARTIKMVEDRVVVNGVTAGNDAKPAKRNWWQALKGKGGTTASNNSAPAASAPAPASSAPVSNAPARTMGTTTPPPAGSGMV